MCDTPVILTSFDGDAQLEYWASARRLIDYPHLKTLVETKGVDVVDSYTKLVETIQKYINDQDTNLENRISSVNQYCSNYQEMSTEKVVNLYINTLGHEQN